MLLNHARKTPRDWDDATPSLCPECSAPLLPRRGRVLVWHWAHRGVARDGSRTGCEGGGETAWHRAWKSVYHDLARWEIEVPLDLDGERFRLDAARLPLVREFVHSLSEKYVRKHLALKSAGLDVLWIYDGGQFVAERARTVRGGGIKHLLKPRARWLHAEVGGLVHHDHRLWRHWEGDVWYPIEYGRPASLALAFDRHLADLKARSPA